MNETQSIIARAELKDHKIEILEIVELDMDGNPAVSKKMVLVDTPTNGRQVMNVSPFGSTADMLLMARIWVHLGCPMGADQFGIPTKWNLSNLLQSDRERNLCK
jgi:hypothetical protein